MWISSCWLRVLIFIVCLLGPIQVQGGTLDGWRYSESTDHFADTYSLRIDTTKNRSTNLIIGWETETGWYMKVRCGSSDMSSTDDQEIWLRFDEGVVHHVTGLGASGGKVLLQLQPEEIMLLMDSMEQSKTLWLRYTKCPNDVPDAPTVERKPIDERIKLADLRVALHYLQKRVNEITLEEE